MTYKEHKKKRDKEIVQAYYEMNVQGFKSLESIKIINDKFKISQRCVYNVLRAANVQLKKRTIK